MNWKFYGIRGRCGYVHVFCLAAYKNSHTVFDAQGRSIHIPEVDSLIMDLGHIDSKCLHCGKPLVI